MINPKHILDVINNSRYLKIPFFQRSYVWEEENWKRFLDDMKEISKDKQNTYFMGSYIIKKEENTEADGPETRLVIDGQQRFTTIILFLFVLYKKQNNVDEFKKHFFIKGRIALIHNHNDQEIFENILNEEEIDLQKYSDSNIFKAYDYFMKNINVNEYALDAILYRLVCFTAIELEYNDDEQQVFDTINSLGVRLTVADLIKNCLYSGKDEEKFYNKTWRKTFEKSKEIREFWDTIIGTGSNQRSLLDLFFDSYLTMKSDFKFSQHDLFSTFKKYLKGIDFKNNKEKEIKEIMELAGLFYDNLNPEIIEEAIGGEANAIDKLNLIFFGLDITTFIPYFLFILQNKKEKENECNAIFAYLEKYLIRRMLCKENTKSYKNLCQKLIKKKCNSLESLKANLSLDNENMSIPSDKKIQESLKEKNLSNEQAKGILYLLEINLRNTKDSTQLLGLKKYELEHIMPNTWNIISWPLTDGYDEDTRNKYIQMLGNKTILNGRLNKAIKNKEWNIKKNGKGNHKGYVDYAQGLKTFLFNDIHSWDETKIDERNTQLYEQICSAWPVDNQ